MITQLAHDNGSDAIPQEVALRLCSELREQYAGKWWTFAGLQCWGCWKFSKGDPARMCFSGSPDFRGCALVNARYADDRPPPPPTNV